MRREATVLLEKQNIARNRVRQPRDVGRRREGNQRTAGAAAETENARAAGHSRDARVVTERDDEVAFVEHQTRQVLALAAEGDDFEPATNTRIDLVQRSRESMKEG